MVTIRAIDFEYDGQYLSEYGFIICDFNYSTTAVEATAGSVITFNKVPRNQGKIFSLASTQYGECITTTFDICKNPDIYDLDHREISSDEFTDIMRWLNRREYLKFAVLEDAEYEHELCYYMASFNVSKIKINEKLYGMRLVLETDKPFGYGQEYETVFNFTRAGESKVLTDKSYEIGSIYPTVTIECKSSGDLSLYNELEDCKTVIKNCSSGEIITLHGDTMIIESSLDSHDICNDFNFEFFRIGNDFSDKNNVITASIPCEITIVYSPVIKDAP